MIGLMRQARPRHPRSYRVGLWSLVLPFLVGSFVLVLAPAVVTAAFAFTRYDGLAPPDFLGLQVFVDLFRDPETADSFRATGIFLAIAVPLRIAAGLGLALLLHRSEPGVRATRVAAYVPVVIPDVAVALLWLWLTNPAYGPVGILARGVGAGEAPLVFDDWGARLVVVAIAVFAVGEGFLITLAARRELPSVLYDVARTEGAAGWTLFRTVTLPMLTPVLGLLTARDLVLSMQVTLVPVILVTGGGPFNATKTLPVYAYERGFLEIRFGDAAAIAVVLVVLTCAIVALQFRLLRRWNRAGTLPG